MILSRGGIMSDDLLIVFSEVLELPIDKLNNEISPDNTSKWDSLAAMHLVAAIEDRFKVHLSTKEIMQMANIGAARELLKQKKVIM